MRMLCFGLMAAAMSLLNGHAASAQDKPQSQAIRRASVVELYTSQGCSSCPAADALLKEFVDRPDVIALSLPVDYWDYLGWKDTLASAKFTARQRLYAKMRGDGKIYTPQIVVNGLTHVNGAHATEIEEAIAKTSARLAPEHIPVRIFSSGGKITIETGAVAEGDKPRDGTVWLATIEKQVEVPVRAGENRGKTLTYYNVVRELRQIGTWNGKPVTFGLSRSTVMKPGVDACAVLLQTGVTGPIVGAALLASAQ